jgi:hypothetical protein
MQEFETVKISEISKDDAKQFIYDAYQSAVAAHDDEPLEGGHPSRVIAGWAKLAQGRDGLPGNVGLAKPIENNPLEDGDPLAEADTSSPVSPSAANRSHGKTAIDGHYQLGTDGVPRFTTPGGFVIVGDAALAARARQGNTASISATERAIPGYGRLK